MLDEARDEILAVRAKTTQNVNAVSLDLADVAQVEAAFRGQPQLPDAVYCVAGGTSTETGFMVDISAEDLERCMRNNYLTSAYAAHTAFRLWVEDDKQQENQNKGPRKTRQIVFISSAAALVGFPGYVAYARMLSSSCSLGTSLLAC